MAREGDRFILEAVLGQNLSGWSGVQTSQFEFYVPDGMEADVTLLWSQSPSPTWSTSSWDLTALATLHEQQRDGFGHVCHEVFSGRTLPEIWRLSGPGRFRVDATLVDPVEVLNRLIAQVVAFPSRAMCREDLQQRFTEFEAFGIRLTKPEWIGT